MINWNSIKLTNGLTDTYDVIINENQTEVNINGYSIPLSENGIEIEWWNNPLSEEEIKELIPKGIRNYIDLNTIHQEKGGILGSYVFEKHNVNNMIKEEVIDWMETRDIKVFNNINPKPSIDMVIKKGENESKKILSISQFFGISEEHANNKNFENCMNLLMKTEHNDPYYLDKISKMTHLTELGDPNNSSELSYVESKIIKFLLIKPEEIGKCFDLVYITEKLCNGGMSSSALELLGYILNLNTQTIDDENYDNNLKVISERLFKYVSEIISKIISIAEYYEKGKCNGEIHKNTILLKKMYDNLSKTKNDKIIDIDFFSLDGIINFFKDFQDNIITKVILLIFIAFIVSQVLSLFKVQYNINK